MPPIALQTCEAKIDDTWRTVSLAEARSVYTFAVKRCSTCHGQVVVTGSYTEGAKLALQHRRAHDGCSHVPARFRGTPLLHPQAMA